MKPLIIHHGGCTDGVGAAWWLAKHLEDEPDVLPWGYDALPPTIEQVAGRAVFIVDFCFHDDVLDDITEHAASLIVLDHHETAVGYVAAAQAQTFSSVARWAELGSPTTALIVNQGRSGIGNVIQFCDMMGSPLAVPEFLYDLEDRDLWRFERPRTRDTFAAVTARPLTFENFDEISVMDIEDVWAEGAGINRYRDRLVSEVAASTFTLWLRAPHPDPKHHILVDIPCASSPYMIGSDVAGQLAEQSETGVGAYCILHAEDVQIGLRARKGGRNVAEIAEGYGGGGHPGASGLRLTYEQFAEARQ